MEEEEEREGEGSLTSNEGWEKMDTGSSEEMMETQREKKKSFSVGSIEVRILLDIFHESKKISLFSPTASKFN